jgi:hypothetical protein
MIILVCIFILFLSLGESDAVDEPALLTGFSSLRNDDNMSLLKPLGAPPVLEKKPEIEKKEKPDIIPLPTTEVKKVKIPEVEVSPEEKKEIEEDIIPKPVSIPKPKDIVTLPEESEFFLKLSQEQEVLPAIPERKPERERVVPIFRAEKKVVKKPPVVPVSKKKEEKVVVAKPVVPEDKLISTGTVVAGATITPTAAPVTTKQKQLKKKFSWKDTKPALRRGLIISGLASLFLIFLIVYLWQKGATLPEEVAAGNTAGGKVIMAKHKSLEHEIKEIKIGYKSIEKLINDIEKKLLPLSPLKGINIDEFVNNTIRDVIRPIEGGIKSLQNTCHGLEKMFNELDKRLAPINALKGLSLKDLAYQTSTELIKPIENDIKQLKTDYERLINEIDKKMEEKVDKKVEIVQKKSKGLEKMIDNIDSRLVSLDSLVSSLSLFESAATGIKTQHKETAKSASEEKQRKDKEALYSQIYKMSDEGLSIDEIAQRTKMGKGEVRLILGLRKK